VIFVDYSPPAVPSAEEQRDALRKGLGRVVQWASAGRLDDGLLLDACLHDQRYDMQCEEGRAEWLWHLMESVGVRDRFRSAILEALRDANVDRNAGQLCELTFRYARAGDQEARSALYEVVEHRPVVDHPTLGRNELVDLDGEDAVVFVARVVGAATDHGWDWPDDSFVEDAVHRFGREQVESLLLGSTDPAVLRFGEAWRRHERGRRDSPRQSHADRMRAIGVEEVFEAAQCGQGRYWFRGWGMHADEHDVNVVYARLCADPDPFVRSRLLRVFANRPLPDFDPRLLDLCEHADEDVRRGAASAISKTTHPAIRRLAVDQLSRGEIDPAIELLASNFEAGDEDRILAAMEMPDEAEELHGLAFVLFETMEANPGIECPRLAVVVYRFSPCQNCRVNAVRLLHCWGCAPGWLADECRNDCDEGCRSLFAESED
jgi:hypothetical protein